MLALVVKKSEAEKVKRMLYEKGLIDERRKVKRRDGEVELPLKDSAGLGNFNYEIIEQEEPVFKQPTPFEEIKKIIGKEDIPRKWEKIGDVLILNGINGNEEIARVYAEVLKCKSVVEDIGGIKGVKRIPCFKLVYGNSTETIHVENGIKYKLDVQKIMFSSGNIDERIRMAKVANKNEVVVDMFAGIGYFSLPIAVYGRARVYACEINKVAYNYLKENIILNEVFDLVTPLLGDCREVAPKNIANRIIMGYLNSFDFFEHSLKILNNEGVIHFHQKCKKEDFPDKIFDKLKKVAIKNGKKLEMILSKKIKSYAPGIIHGVIDLKVS
ncbi:MAG: class I SAM-dependent methyltransferase family protein [Thermoplasmatales archaeon]|nr:class I SAM-dependent methyltransferase family protein [Thermoplasmatales archaeon]